MLLLSERTVRNREEIVIIRDDAAQREGALTTMLCALEPAIEKMRASIGLAVGVVAFILEVDKADVVATKLTDVND